MIRTTDPHGVEKLHHSAGRHPQEDAGRRRRDMARKTMTGRVGPRQIVRRRGSRVASRSRRHHTHWSVHRHHSGSAHRAWAGCSSPHVGMTSSSRGPLNCRRRRRATGQFSPFNGPAFAAASAPLETPVEPRGLRIEAAPTRQIRASVAIHSRGMQAKSTTSGWSTRLTSATRVTWASPARRHKDIACRQLASVVEHRFKGLAPRILAVAVALRPSGALRIARRARRRGRRQGSRGSSR